MEYQRCRFCLEDTDKFMDIFQDSFPEMILILTGLKVGNILINFALKHVTYLFNTRKVF